MKKLKKKKRWNDGENSKGANRLKEILAAGAVLYRQGNEGVEVAVVHRPRYDDWSLPKGKLDSGESLPVTAVRELKEETGFSAILGQRLGTTHYAVQDGARKQVAYWAAAAGNGEFTVSDECDEMLWLPVDEAATRVTYALDEDVLNRFRAQVLPYLDSMRTVLLVRHARAGDRSMWPGRDAARPLDTKGRRQAEYLAPLLRAFGASTVIAAEPTRCAQTVAPLAEELNVPVLIEPAVGDVVAGRDPKPGVAAIQALIGPETSGIPVICSQGDAIPAMLQRFAEGTLLADEKFTTKKAGVWVLTFVDGSLHAADYFADPLPYKR